MRIYVACLASYNNGVLHGRWIEASTDIDAMQDEINAMLRESRFPNVTVKHPETGETVPSAEEWAIHDSEGLGNLGEYASLSEVAKRAGVADLAEDRDIPLPVLMEFASDYMSGDWDSSDLESELDDRYRGKYDDWASFAQEFTEETSDMSTVPEWLQGYIDWESFGRDMHLSGEFVGHRVDGDLYVFWAC